MSFLKDHITVVNTLDRFANDPLIFELMRRLVEERPVAAPANRPSVNGFAVTRRGAVWNTGIREAIEKLLPALNGEFTYVDVIRRLDESGYHIAAKDHRSAVTRVLGKLLKANLIVEIRKGNGGGCSVYKVRGETVIQ